MNNKKCLEHDISNLKIDQTTINILKENSILKIYDLCILKRKNLKDDTINGIRFKSKII